MKLGILDARHTVTVRRAMVPEVLLALLGVPGEVITLVPATSDGGRERFRVSPDLPFLEPPERASLDRLVSLGYAFRCLERFVAREDEAGTTAATAPSDGTHFAFNTPASGGSLYRRALAAGVSEVLASYECAILRLEQDILRGVTPALPAALESALSGFALVLPALHATLRPVIERPDLKGAPLLHHLHAAALAAGAPQLESALRSLRARCYRAMYQQCPGLDRARHAGGSARRVLGRARGRCGGRRRGPPRRFRRTRHSCVHPAKWNQRLARVRARGRSFR